MSIHRYERVIDPQMLARNMDNQKQKMIIACGDLKHFTELGMPKVIEPPEGYRKTDGLKKPSITRYLSHMG